MAGILIADSGSTKTEWCLLTGNKKKTVQTQGLSPYFLSGAEMQEILSKELLPKLGRSEVGDVFFYGSGCGTAANSAMVRKVLKSLFRNASVSVDHDLMGAATALCGEEKGIACILGTGSNSCYFNGKKIMKNSPGLGYVLGDEGGGTQLGRKVLQYYLYKTFEPDLMDRFDQKYKTNSAEILDAVYKKPLPNRYLAKFAGFLSENRGHFMIENILEDCFNDFFFNHIFKYRESWTTPIHFVGSVSFAFKDVLQQLCSSYELQLGRVLKNPMDGLVKYHRS